MAIEVTYQQTAVSSATIPVATVGRCGTQRVSSCDGFTLSKELSLADDRYWREHSFTPTKISGMAARNIEFEEEVCQLGLRCVLTRNSRIVRKKRRSSSSHSELRTRSDSRS